MANENHGRQCKYFQKQNGMVCYGLCTVVFPNNISSITSFCSRAMESSSESGQVADDSIEVVVSLPSGRCEAVAAQQSGTIADLKVAAQQSLGQGFLRLATPDGRSFRSNRISSAFRASEWRQPYCCCTAAKDSCNLVCVCFVVCLEETELSRGVIQTRVVTAPVSKTGSGMSSRSVAHIVLSLRFWQMEAL